MNRVYLCEDQVLFEEEQRQPKILTSSARRSRHGPSITGKHHSLTISVVRCRQREQGIPAHCAYDMDVNQVIHTFLDTPVTRRLQHAARGAKVTILLYIVGRRLCHATTERSHQSRSSGRCTIVFAIISGQSGRRS